MSSRDRHRLPERLDRSVEAELARVGSPGASKPFAAMLRIWPEAVGGAIARNAWPARAARDGVVVVHVSSSAWAHELTQLEETLRERLGDAAPERLRFTVGPIPEPGAKEPEPSGAAAATPSPEDERLAESLTAGIEEQVLREAVKRAAALSLAAGRSPRPDRSL